MNAVLVLALGLFLTGCMSGRPPASHAAGDFPVKIPDQMNHPNVRPMPDTYSDRSNGQMRFLIITREGPEQVLCKNLKGDRPYCF